MKKSLKQYKLLLRLFTPKGAEKHLKRDVIGPVTRALM